jgi:hypothetical protein
VFDAAGMVENQDGVRLIGEDGAVVLPGDAEGSKIITLQQEGGHPGQLSDEEIAALSQWIQDGAPEK